MIMTMALWALAATVQIPSSTEQTELNAEFQALETKLRTAIKQKDATTLDAMLAKEFGYRLAIAGGRPQVMSRPEWLKAGSYYTLEDFAIHELVSRRFDDVVVVDFTFRATATLGSQDRSGEFTNTDVWVKQSGAWKLAARYASRPDSLAPAQK
jgi:hypothetical protein